MILVTVGSLDPFDRMVRLVDEWAGQVGRCDVMAQIGRGEYTPKHLKYERFLDPNDLRQRMAEARAVVGHAGMGTVLTALELGTPLLVFPRQARFHETRNDHQIATARRLAETGRVLVAFTPEQLFEGLGQVERQDPGTHKIGPVASPPLIDRIERFLRDERRPGPGNLRSRKSPGSQ